MYTENDLITQAQPYLKKLCHRRWCNLEPEDRLAEANLLFLCCLRSWPLETGRFLADFEEVLIPYMDQKNSEAPARYFGGDCSLDARHSAQNGESSWCGYELLEGEGIDESKVDVELFLHGLAPEERRLLQALLYHGLSRSKAAEGLDMTAYQLRKYLGGLWERYEVGRW